ncbi:flagellar hook-associated protein FlgK [Campylobacter canadensis]|uniref:Flagellar hook-associated protein 1 n=1 Tax=Campylobacter canadensis TaxID=449520 RepID=A0ABS7WRU3_9BACT|nr:flagellar hook-associated protein FlgK [Campylobacter canadensis]MBZ7987475.1 flagellar hook-associated protein FlgK [Campylobacter canadensis]MBZ7994818.1 flagellar hook-associated protein FlgK [Campylobacter canadensis]MBZ7996397.1 flagellar hook-associated protein FlgK [Campylobacter canadensis]MBZ7998431.1 flagellar hook-associated protein FlgK [Campylobacter canadensis]MBZ8000145.1 flagellar hook-associated protein FlgK [Campylobacter canadensis]
MSIFSTLNTGVTGMNAAQVQISTTGHNLTNANNSYYTRQRVVQQAREGLHVPAGDIGLGTKVKTIVRIHDEYVFAKLQQNTSNYEQTKYLKTKLEEAAQRFPDLKQNTGLLYDLKNYQVAWNKFASNPADGSMKINLIQQAQTLTTNISKTTTDLKTMQKTVNTDIELSIEEINRLGKDIANLNAKISAIESVADSHANDLRDQRDELELRIMKLVNAKVFKENITQDVSFDTPIKDGGLNYHLNIEGFSIVDGETFHPLKLTSVSSGSDFTRVYYELQDGTTADLTTKLNGGQLGAQLDLRGRFFDNEKGEFADGILQGYIDNMNSFAKGIIVNTNNIYAKAAQDKVISQPIHNLKPDDTLMTHDNRLKQGSFDLIVYDNEGKEVARKTITIDSSTSMISNGRTSSLIEKINSNTDDNNDNNGLNDFDDFFQAQYSYDEKTQTGAFSLASKQDGYKVAISDNGTNIAGIFGLGKFFEGNDAQSINVDTNLRQDPSTLKASSSGTDGNNDVANELNQMQYNEIEFYNGNSVSTNTIEGFFRQLTTDIAAKAQNNNSLNDTNKVLLENVQSEFASISGVDTNEELANLMKFQASFGASAKIITTVDKMLETLLGLKQ